MINYLLGGGGGTSGTLDGRTPGCFFWVLPKRSIPKPDQYRKDVIQQESLSTDSVRIELEINNIIKLSNY